MARNPALNLEELLARDPEAAQLLADVFEAQDRQAAQAERLRNDLREMRERQQNVNRYWRAERGRGFRAPVPRLQDRLHWFDDPEPRRDREEAYMQDVGLAYGNLARLCELVLHELNREEEVGDEGEYGGAGGGAMLPPDQHEPQLPAGREPGVGPIRPPGRAARRRVPYTISSQRGQNNFLEVALELDERDFRKVFRVGTRTFWEIVELIRPNEVFVNRGRRKQRPVHHQLAAFLIRYGSMGSRSDFTAILTSVGNGSVPIYCKQVAYAIRVYGLNCVGWPTAERKEEIKAAFREICGLDGIIGVLDGSLIDLVRRPLGSEESFRSRKGTVATNIQAIVDHEGRFIAYETGFPGSKNDTWIWKRSFVWRKRRAHFNPGEFLLADGGYPLSPLVLIPFSRNERQGVDRRRKIQFNQHISKARVLIERTFGQLKLRFPSLTMMGDIGKEDTLYDAIEAMMVLHNICYDLHDTVSGEPDAFIEGGGVYDAVDQEPEDMDWGVGGDINEEVLAAGRAFRAQCMELICPVE